MKQLPSAPEYSISIDGVVKKGSRLLKVNTKGCIRVSIRRKMRLLAELLAETYLGMPSDGQHTVCYLDGDNTNLSLENLYWVDPWFNQIPKQTTRFEGKEFFRMDWLETKQYFISKSGDILNFSKQKLVVSQKDSIGYLRFTYYILKKGKRNRKTIAVHIACYKTFNPNFDSLHQEINHKNGVKTDNRIENLEAVSHAENMKHAFDTGLRQVKYSRDVAGDIASKVLSGKSWTDIYREYLAPELGLTKQQSFSLINAVVNNQDAYMDVKQKHGLTQGSTTISKESTVQANGTGNGGTP